MPLINTLGKQLTGQDIQTLKNLLRGSLENHIRRIEEAKSYAENNEETGLEFYDNIHAIYTEGLAQLETKINLALASQNTISVDGFINGMFSDMEKQAYEYLKTLPENDKRKDTFMGEVAMNFGGRDIQKFYGKEGEDWGIADQDLPEAFTNTTAPFMLATEPMEGVADIGTYDPNSMSVKLLFSGRSGNSTTLSRSVEDLSREREQILNDDKLDDRQKEERVKILDRRIIETRNAVYGMNAGAEIARIHSSQMMAKKDPITFSDLYNAFSELNQALRPADPEGGTLRAHYVHAGAIKGVHGSFVPSTLIKTLDMIADGMNQVKATEDINLRKTRAIQLSSFAYTMMVSEHVFGDGNGRTCRLFADTILQTFGLPPYIPVNDKEIKIHTLGKSMDFNKAADVFLKGVKASDNILKPQIQAINDAKEAEARRGRDGMESLVRNINENVRHFNEAYANTKPAEADDYAANLSSKIQAERRYGYFLDAIFNPVSGLSNEDCMAVMSDQDKDTIQRQMVFVSIRRIRERAVKPDGTKYPLVGDGSILNLPYEEQKKLYDQYITNEEKSGIQRDAMKNMLSKNPQRLETFIGDLSGRLGPRMGAFYDFVRNAPGVEKELSHQEKRVYSYNGRIAELRNQIQSNTAYTDAQKEQYLAALNNAEELTASGKQELCAEGDVLEKAYAKIKNERDKKSIAARKERFKDSDGIAHRPMFKGEGGAEGLLPERENRLRGVYDTGAPLTYEYKQTIVRMLQKMRDMEVLPKDDIYAGRAENGTKDYAFRNLLNARSDYKDAITNGDIDKLPELKERYDKEYQNIKELMDMAHEGLGDKPYNMPGNLNGHRHDKMFPYELLEDMTAQSQVNGVYQIYLAMHRLNMDDAQEFMDNFGENMVRAEAVRGEKFSLKNCLNGKNDMDSLLDVIAGDEAGKYFGSYELMMGVNRWPDSLGNMAPDGEDFDAISEYSDNVMAAMDDVKARYLSKFQILTYNYDQFRDQPGYDVIMQARKNTLENLITVEDYDRDPDQIIGVQGANPDGTLKEVFDINAYAASHQPDLGAMKQRVDKMLQKFEGISSEGAVKKADVLQAAARSYARLLKVHAIESGSQWYQDLKQMSVELMDTMEKDPAVAAEDKAVLNAAVRKNHMSPKEAQFLLNEMTYMLTEDEGIRNEWKNLYEQKPEKADMILNNNKIEQNGKENFLDYANLFAKRSEKPFEEANKEHNTIRDSSKITWAGHKANNIKDPLTLITTFFELPQETQDRMPQLKEYMKKRAPLMEFLVNANTATDFEAHTSMDAGLYSYGYNTKRNGEFDKGILYNSNDGVRNRSDGLGRCDTLKEIPDREKVESNGRYYLSNIEKAAGLTNEAAKEKLLEDFEKAAYSNNFRSEKVRGQLEASASEIRGIAAEGTYRRAWDAMPKTKWWHKTPDPNAAITKVQEAVEALNTAMDSLGNDMSAGKREAIEQKLRDTIEASERYLNEKDAQKNISTDLSAEERLSRNNVRSGFGQQRYQAVYDIRKDCMAKLESLQRENRKYNDISKELEETLSLEQKENEYFSKLEKNNDSINREIDSLKAERDRLKTELGGMDNKKKELQQDLTDFQNANKEIKEKKDTAKQNYVYNECKKNPVYSRNMVDIENIDSAERRFRENSASDKTVSREQFNAQIKAYNEQRKIARDEIKMIVAEAMKKYESTGQKERDERKAEEQVRDAYCNNKVKYNGMTPDKASEKFDEIMKGKTQQRLETFEFEERWPVQKKLNDLNGKIKELSEKIKEPEDTAAMWKEHDNKFRAQNKERKVEVAKDVIKEIQNKPSASNNHVHRSNNAPQNEHKKVKQM